MVSISSLLGLVHAGCLFLAFHPPSWYRGWIELAPKTGRAEADVLLPWHGERSLALADGGELIAAEGVGNGVSAVRLEMAPVTVRRRHGGERLRTAHARHSRTLKNLLQEAGVPPWLRGRMPLVYCGDALVWAPFVGVAAEFRAHATEAGSQRALRERGREIFRGRLRARTLSGGGRHLAAAIAARGIDDALDRQILARCGRDLALWLLRRRR